MGCCTVGFQGGSAVNSSFKGTFRYHKRVLTIGDIQAQESPITAKTCEAKHLLLHLTLRAGFPPDRSSFFLEHRLSFLFEQPPLAFIRMPSNLARRNMEIMSGQ